MLHIPMLHVTMSHIAMSHIAMSHIAMSHIAMSHIAMSRMAWSQKTRIVVAIIILVVVAGAILGIDAISRSRTVTPESLPPGAIPVYIDGRLVGGITPADLEGVAEVSFEDREQGVTQSGWLLRDVVALRAGRARLRDSAVIRVSSSSRNKAAEVTWAEANHPANYVMFDLSNRGTLKLVSLLERLDSREEWVQDVDRIEVTTQ